MAWIFLLFDFSTVLGGFGGVFFASLCSLQDLSSLTRNQTRVPCSGSVES